MQQRRARPPSDLQGAERPRRDTDRPTVPAPAGLIDGLVDEIAFPRPASVPQPEVRGDAPTVRPPSAAQAALDVAHAEAREAHAARKAAAIGVEIEEAPITEADLVSERPPPIDDPAPAPEQAVAPETPPAPVARPQGALDGLFARVENAPSADSAPAPRVFPRRRGRTAIVAGAVIGVAALAALAWVVLPGLLGSGASSATPAASPPADESPAPTPTRAQSPTPTPTRAQSPTPTPTPTPTRAQSPTPTPTPTSSSSSSAEVSDELVVRGNRSARGGELDAALALYGRALELDPHNPRAVAGIARVHLARRQWPDAVSWSKRATDMRPRRAEYRVLYGDALNGSGDRTAARAAWQDALELDPESGEARSRANR